jgi:hypothetical protein
MKEQRQEFSFDNPRAGGLGVERRQVEGRLPGSVALGVVGSATEDGEGEMMPKTITMNRREVFDVLPSHGRAFAWRPADDG